MSSSQYMLTPQALYLDSGREYTLTIRDLPVDKRPRERLSSQGPEALSTAELLAIVLGIGTTKEEVLAMSRRIMTEYGEKSILRERVPEKLAQDLDIPLGKAMQIVACGELGRRFFAKNETAAPIVRTARDVFEHVADMRALPKEHLRGLYLNAHYKVIRDEVISIGTIDANIVHPREVFRPALEYAAAAVILVHNHPSGEIAPSQADIVVTEQLIEAGALLGINLVDHVIVTKNEFVSVSAQYRS